MALGTMAENLRLPLTWAGAVLVAALLLLSSGRWEETWGLSSVLFAAGMALVGIASLGRLWCALYIAGYKDDRLVTDGPYAMCRNPLYLFSFIGAIGVGLCTETFTIAAILTLLFTAAYPAVICGEEARLARHFGEAYQEYRRCTPAFFPKIGLLREPATYLVNPRVFRRSLFDALWFIWIVGILEVVEELHHLGLLPVFWRLY